MDASDLREKAVTCRRLAATLPCNKTARQALLDEAEVFERRARELEIREHKRTSREFLDRPRGGRERGNSP